MRDATSDGGTLVVRRREADGSWSDVPGADGIRLAYAENGVLYIAQPQGGAPTRFAATVISDTLAVFENPAHDFPQRIAYVRVHADSVVARISAAKDGRERGMAIPMGRRACAP